MTGLYTPTAADVAAGRSIGFGKCRHCLCPHLTMCSRRIQLKSCQQIDKCSKAGGFLSSQAMCLLDMQGLQGSGLLQPVASVVRLSAAAAARLMRLGCLLLCASQVGPPTSSTVGWSAAAARPRHRSWTGLDTTSATVTYLGSHMAATLTAPHSSTTETLTRKTVVLTVIMLASFVPEQLLAATCFAAFWFVQGICSSQLIIIWLELCASSVLDCCCPPAACSCSSGCRQCGRPCPASSFPLQLLLLTHLAHHVLGSHLADSVLAWCGVVLSIACLEVFGDDLLFRGPSVVQPQALILPSCCVTLSASAA